MLDKTYPYYLANEPRTSSTLMEVYDKYSGEVATRVAVPDDAATEEAISAAVAAAGPMKNFKPWARQAVLQHWRCASKRASRSWMPPAKSRA
jgi:aldehyde dehydrogenase (NAD+)